jgi:hypothetical protein
MDRKAARAKKGLPPRVTFLANWDSGDEERYDDTQVRKREQLARKGKPKASKGSKDAVVPGKGIATHPSERRSTA